MNIFCVQRDPALAAIDLCDQHVVKMPTETAQCLNDALFLMGLPLVLRKFNPKHPSPAWCNSDRVNFDWALAHGMALCIEYNRRYGKTHASEEHLVKIKNMIEFNTGKCCSTRFWDRKIDLLYVGPKEYDVGDTVLSYRNFYNLDKSRFARWRHSQVPAWYSPGMIYTGRLV